MIGWSGTTSGGLGDQPIPNKNEVNSQRSSSDPGTPFFAKKHQTPMLPMLETPKPDWMVKLHKNILFIVVIVPFD